MNFDPDALMYLVIETSREVQVSLNGTFLNTSMEIS